MTTEEAQRRRRRRGYWLRLARLRADLNQNEVARRLGMSDRSGTTVLAWEQGRRDPKASVLEQLAEIYGVPPELLLKPPPTDEERLDEIVRAASALEREDWDAGEGSRGPGAGAGPAAEPRRRSA